MKKPFCYTKGEYPFFQKKIIRIMKLTTFFLIVNLLQVGASGYSQARRFTFQMDNISIKEAFSVIESQSSFKFVYRDGDIENKTVSLQMSNSSIEDVLQTVLANSGSTYRILDNNLVVIVPNSSVQQQKVTGKVTDAITGEALPGVSVGVEGTTSGVVTGIDGDYSLELPGPEATLVFSYVGYMTEKIGVQGKSQINVTLAQDIKTLDEVVVTGYGTQKKATLTGALEQVSSKAFESRAITNPALALQGETPGLVVTRNSSRPGNEGVNFQIRGATSVNGGSPLIVIDGVPVIENKNGDGVSITNSFYSMNPDDIESATILKDGMAAIYGSRAANGVILITTKRGKGKMKIDYNGSYRINTMGIKTPSATMQQYATLWLDANQEETTPNWWGWQTKENMQKMQQGIEGIYPTQYWGDIFIGDGDRIKEMFATRISQQHNLSISGSTDKTNYRLSAGYSDNVGNLATAYDGKKQYSIKLNYDYKVSDRIKLQSGITYQKDNTSSPSGGLSGDMFASDPSFFPAKNPYGQWYSNFGNAGNKNAVAQTTDGGRNIRENNLTRIDLKANIGILKGLELEGAASIQTNQYRQDMYNLTVPLYQWDGTVANGALNSTSNIRVESDNTFYQNYNLLLRYTKDLGDHHFSAMAGINAEKNDFKGLYVYRTLIPSNGVYDLNVASTTGLEGTGGQNHWGLYSYLERFNYSFKDKYLVEVLGRRDGSSQFASGFKYSNFGNVSAGWVLTNEEFVKKLNLSSLSFLKLRGSYGETGNKVGIGLYDYVSQVIKGTMIFGSTPANQTTSHLLNDGLTSVTRTWERVKMSNIGVDMNFLKDRLSASFDYYKKRNDGMLINVTYPTVLGGSAPKTNAGVLDIHGWEATLGWKDVVGKVTYNVAFNMSDSRNKLISMEGANTIKAGKVNDPNNSDPTKAPWVTGRPLNSWFMYETDGYFRDQDDVNAYYAKYTSVNQGELPSISDPSVKLRPGDIKKVDLDGNGYISSSGGTGDKGDLKFMGDAAPHFIFGVNMGGAWNGFDLGLFFQGVLKQNIQRSQTMAYPFAAIWTNQNASFIGKTWTETNTNAEFPRLTVNGTRAGWNYANNDFMLQNNRYVRLKSLVIGYTLPKLLTEKVKIDRVRVYFSGNDLFEFTSIKDGFDPEQGEVSTNDGYPFMRTWSFGLNLSF
jgi:TonB-linked SusC/RagA family outer membrane protein